MLEGITLKGNNQEHYEGITQDMFISEKKANQAAYNYEKRSVEENKA